MKNANRDINDLMDYANKSLQEINNKKAIINDLIVTVVNFTDENRDKPERIMKVCMITHNSSFKSEFTFKRVSELQIGV